MKIVILLLIVILLVISFVFVFNFSRKASKAVDELNQERYTRMVAEENLDQTKSKLESVQAELNRAESKAESLGKLLEQKEVVIGDLKMRLDKVLKTKEALEKRINELGSIVSPVGDMQ